MRLRSFITLTNAAAVALAAVASVSIVPGVVHAVPTCTKTFGESSVRGAAHA